MEKQIVAGAIFLLTFISPTPSQNNPKIQKKVNDAKTYTVQSGETLSMIAKKEYGSEDYWTSLWNDNDWIKNSNLIEKGQKIKLRTKPPINTEQLKPELAQKFSQQNLITYQYSPVSTPPAPSSNSESLSEDQINFLGNCESGMTPERNSGNGFYGAFQFTPGTWNNMGTGYGRADQAPLEVQKDAVQRLLQKSSIYSQFPGCSVKMRSSGLL